jgi:rubrerythrin
MATEQEKTLEALKTAIKMEIDGKRYYQKMSQTSDNKLGIRLFQRLAAEEDIHRMIFEDIYKAIQLKKAWPKVGYNPNKGKELKTLFSLASQDAKSSSSELQAIQTAMDMENKTRDFYQDQAAKASFEAERKYYLTLVGEESAHHAALLDYYEYLKNPEGWFTMKERHSLDGG